MHTGKMVSDALEAKGMTQSELALKLKITRQRAAFIASMPSCSLGTLERVAKALDMPLWELIKNYGGGK